MITLLEWLKRLIAAIVAWLKGPAQGLAVPIEIAPDPHRPDHQSWLDIPLEVATDEHPTSAILSLPSSSDILPKQKRSNPCPSYQYKTEHASSAASCAIGLRPDR